MFGPKLRITGLTRRFAEHIGLMNISVATAHDIEMDGKPIESPDKTLSSESDDTTKYATPMVDCHVTSSAPNLPDPSKFPLLYSLGVCTTKHMNRLVQEIAKFHGDTSISFTHRNNRTGTLIVLPSNQTPTLLSRKQNLHLMKW